MKKETVKTADKSTAKWGTVQWVISWPYSKCDRKRKARIARAVGEDTLKGILECSSRLYKWDATILEIQNKYNVTLTKKDAARVDKAYNVLVDYCEVIRDAAIASALCKAWGLDTEGSSK